MKTALIIILSATAFICLFYAAAAYLLFRYGVYRDKRGADPDAIPNKVKEYKEAIENGRKLFDSAPFETVEITSFDGLKLKGLYLKRENSKGTIILFHGFKSSPRWDYAPSLDFISSLGYDLLYPFQRSHGESEGKYITYGVKERKDAVTWVNFINNKNGYQKDVFLFGISMGCSTVLMGAGEGYPENVRGIIADCGFTSPYDIFRAVYKSVTHIPSAFIFPLFDLFCKKISGFDYKEYSTLKALENTRLPVLFIHGEADTFVPYEMTVRNFDSYKGPKRFFHVKNADHGLSYLVDNEGYKREVIAFISEYSNN